MLLFSHLFILLFILAELPGSLGNMFVAPPHLARASTPVPIATSPYSQPGKYYKIPVVNKIKQKMITKNGGTFVF